MILRASRRFAMSTIEAVLVLGITFPVCAILAVMGIRACLRYWRVIGGLVSWPYL